MKTKFFIQEFKGGKYQKAKTYEIPADTIEEAKEYFRKNVIDEILCKDCGAIYFDKQHIEDFNERSCNWFIGDGYYSENSEIIILDESKPERFSWDVTTYTILNENEL